MSDGKDKDEAPDIAFVAVLHDASCPYAHGAETAATRTTNGPAQVATEAYRTGWQTIFGGKPVTVGQA